MDEETKKIAQETFDALPQDVKDTIFADDYQRILNETASKHHLTVEQLGKLEFETTMILMGVNKRANYPFNLESEVGLDEDEAQAVTSEIDGTIFESVKDSLDKMDMAGIENEKDLNTRLEYEEKKLDEENAETEKSDTSLNTLSDRLKQATIAMPGKKDYSFNKNVESPSASSGSTTAIDPYHEPIDNE